MAHNNHGVLRRNASLVTIVQRLLDPLIAVALLKISTDLWDVPYVQSYWILSIAVFLLSLPIFKGFGLYHPYRIQNFRSLFCKLCLGWFLILTILLFFGFFLKASILFSRPALSTWALITPLTIILTHALVWKALRQIRCKGRNHRYAVIAGINSGSSHLADQIQKSPELGISIQGFFSDLDHNSASTQTYGIERYPILGSIAQLSDYVREHNIDIVYLSLPITSEGKMHYALKHLQDSTACVYYVPDILTFNLMHARTYELGDIPLISIWEIPFSDLQYLSKRIIDICVAALVLFLLSPAMVLISLAIAATSPGPILFKQSRYGLNGQKITVYKFRSMTVQENDDNVRAAQRNDSRVTKVGAFLRRTSLDELPQFINVLQGRMSIVGPRPHAVVHNETYRKLIAGYMLRHKVKPGITGWAQVNGFRGETDTLEKMEKRVEYDLAYLREWSLGLDLKIMFQTARVFLGDSNAY